jgi:hypothetical protein
MLFGEFPSMRAIRGRPARALVAGLLLAGLAVTASDGTASAAPAGLQQVRFRGYTLEVPASWAVIREADHPAGCVRFDQHAIYLGGPGSRESCPSWLFGTTEAVLVQAGPARAARTATENPVAREISATAPGLRVTATFDDDPDTVYKMLAAAGLPAPQIELPDPAILDAAEGRPGPAGGGAGGTGTADAASASPVTGAAAVPVHLPELPATVANYHGLGFDACAAPSARAMSAWYRHSPYGAVGIYIGGSDRACDQANLTSAWVRRQAAAGWRFIPMYAGPQAAFGELKSPAGQGPRAAADAVAQAQALGFGPRTPIYYDMEAYPARDTGVALRFLSAWTRALHRLGYLSGVYSSSRSGVIDLARQYSGHRYTMPDVIYDALWNGSANVLDKVYRRKAWPLDHRLHQFSGNDTQTFGGVSMDVDKNFLNVGLAVPGGTGQATPAVESESVFYEGSGHHLVRVPRAAHGTWGTPVSMGGSLSSAPSAVTVGASVTDVFYRGRGGDLWQASRTAQGWLPAREIALMGVLGSAPRAVAQPNGVIDVFWKGSADDHLWHAQYSPRRGWSGPQRLGGDLAGAPAPVENRFGGIQVFWEGPGPGRSLWHVARHLGSGWSQPASLGMGPLGGAPHAAALPSGAIDVVWRGSTSPHHVWSAYLKPGQPAQGPRDLGGSVSGSPWPAAAAGTLAVFFRGTDAGLWQLQYRTAGRWHQPARLRMGRLGSAPFSAAGMGAGPFEVFWTGVRGALWATASAGGHWSGPRRVGGKVT